MLMCRNLKRVKSTHGGVLILVKLQASAYNFTKINTPPWVFFMLFKLYQWYQIAQHTTYFNKWKLSQKYKTVFSLKTAVCEDMILIKTYSKIFTLNSCTPLVFPAPDIKKLATGGKILLLFDIILYIWLIHL